MGGCLLSQIPIHPHSFHDIWVLSMVFFYLFYHPVGENYTPDNEIAHLFSKRHKKCKYHLCLRQKNTILSMNTCKTSNQLKIQNPLYLNMVPYF